MKNQCLTIKPNRMTLTKFSNGNGMGTLPAIDRPLGFPSFISDTLERLWSDEAVNWMPSVNIKERSEDFVIDLAVPGMNKNDINVEVDNGVLTVRGERKEENSQENEKITRREFHYGSFTRTFTLPDTANPEEVNASYKDGILSLTIAKREESKLKPKKQIRIE
jgi:HSP20 family protein